MINTLLSLQKTQLILLRRLSICWLISILFTSCGDDSERFEVINKLRVIGVSPNPVLSHSGSSSVRITVYALAPKDVTITADTFTDSVRDSYAESGETSIVTGSETYQQLAALQLYTVQADVSLPATPPDQLSLVRGFKTISYHVKLNLKENSADEEKVVGNLVSYLNSADTPQVQPPQLAIVAPSSATIAAGKSPIQATLEKTFDEPYRISWFSDSGKLKSRRSLSTEWEIEAGTHTLVVTARGRKTGAFAISTKDVTVE